MDAQPGPRGSLAMTCIFTANVQWAVHLSPAYLGDVHVGIREQLNQLLLKCASANQHAPTLQHFLHVATLA